MSRPTVVLIAYSCEEGAGSEEGVGWTWASAAAEVADVLVYTRPDGIDGVRASAARAGLPIEVLEVSIPGPLASIAYRKRGGFIYYLIWQAAVAAHLRHLERTRQVDVVHHLTWASDSLPTALLAARAPIRIWGPVGGASRMPWSMYRHLSRHAQVDEVVRDVFNGTFRRTCGDLVARHATQIVALNDDVVRRFERHGTPVLLEPNCALDLTHTRPTHVDGAVSTNDPKQAYFVGRLLGWKGPLLAVEAIAHAPGWHLTFLGDGPEHATITSRAGELGVLDRITLKGRVPRTEVLDAFTTADALLFPAVHDSAPWTIGEASSLGCPVVCLNSGGTTYLAGPNAHVVSMEPSATLPSRLGAALSSLNGRGQAQDWWPVSRLPGILQAWYGISESSPSTAGSGDPSTGDSEVTS